MDKKQLAIELKAWFDATDFNTVNFFIKNEVAKVLKEELTKRKRWKKTRTIKPKICKHCGKVMIKKNGTWICNGFFCP